MELVHLEEGGVAVAELLVVVDGGAVDGGRVDVPWKDSLTYSFLKDVNRRENRVMERGKPRISFEIHSTVRKYG